MTFRNSFLILINHILLPRYAVDLVEAAFNLKNAAFCVEGLTKSIWEQSDEQTFDVENASFEEALSRLTNLLKQRVANHSFIPRTFINALFHRQLEFYLSQLESIERNKFVIYSFFVQLMNELEDQQVGNHLS